MEPLAYRPKLNRRHSPPDPRRWRYELRVTQAPDPNQPLSLAQYFPQPPDDQGQEGSCTANSGCLCAEACGNIAGFPWAGRLSRQGLYYLERVHDGTFPQDYGSTPDESFAADIAFGGLPLETVWPYTTDPAATPPPDFDTATRYLYVSGYQPVNMSSVTSARDAVLTALANKQPLVIGFDWFEGFFNDYGSGAVLNFNSLYTQLAGGHQVTIKGWAPTPAGLLVCQNSWGQTSPARVDLWADSKDGDLFIPLDLLPYLEAEILAAVPAKAPAPVPSPTPPAPGPDVTDAITRIGNAVNELDNALQDLRTANG